MVKVLVIGSGGRCDAICRKIKESELVDFVFCAPGNAGIARHAVNIPIGVEEIDKLAEFAFKEKIDLTIVGPEASLSLGIVDKFTSLGLKIFGPTKAATMIESSKSYAKELMKKYHIPTANYEVFTDYEAALAYIKDKKLPIVLKYDGLAAGKGVIIAKTMEEAKTNLYEMLVDKEFGEAKVVIEDFLEGEEFSYMCFVNGTNVYKMIPARDYKRVYDNDLGPNTGGMGAFTALPFLTESDCEYAYQEIMVKAAKALVAEGRPFMGILYGGLIKTADGIKVIEFNARFGDPETEVVLSCLDSDLYQNICDIMAGTTPKLMWDTRPTLGVVLTSIGYPGSYKKGVKLFIPGFDEGYVYHMGTKISGEDIVTNGGRVLMVVASGYTLEEARINAYNMVSQIDTKELYYRKDIGLKFI